MGYKYNPAYKDASPEVASLGFSSMNHGLIESKVTTPKK